MEAMTLEGEPPVAVTLRRSGRARRLSLRISRHDGRVTLTLPTGTPLAEGRAFAQSRAGWLRARLGDLAPPVEVGHGTAVPVAGVAMQVEPAGAGARGVTVAGDRLLVAGPEAEAGARLTGFLREMARAALSAAVARHAAALGRRPGRLSLRDTRSRWGSCSARGDLMFSWRLAMAAPEVLDYVAAHEVAHLARMDHSPAFWAVVAGLCPGWRAQRDWLRREGPGLLRYRFEG